MAVWLEGKTCSCSEASRSRAGNVRYEDVDYCTFCRGRWERTEEQTLDAEAVANAKPRRTGTATPPAKPNPGLIANAPTDRIVRGNSLLLCSGIENVPNTSGEIVITLRASTLELWSGAYGSAQSGPISIERLDLIDIEIGGGEQVTSGGGFIGGGFGPEGAAIGMAASTLLNAVTTKAKTLPTILILTSVDGVVATSTQMNPLELKGLLAPLFADVLRNRRRLEGGPQAPRLSDDAARQ